MHSCCEKRARDLAMGGVGSKRRTGLSAPKSWELCPNNHSETFPDDNPKDGEKGLTMRRTLGVAFALLSLTVLVACGAPKPPAGRWEGLFEGSDVMIVARLEIDADGVRVSAPNAFMNFAAMSDDQRAAMRANLQYKLAEAWGHVGIMPLDFDGKVFRKPGGVAPQMVWDDEGKQMTLVVYPGVHATIRVPLVPVSEFGEQTS